jgi:hypothetical protein
MMQGWLRARGEEAPDVHAHHAHGATLMPECSRRRRWAVWGRRAAPRSSASSSSS